MIQIVGYAIALTLATARGAPAKIAPSKSAPDLRSPAAGISAADTQLLKTLDATYQSKSAEMKVEKITKLSVLEQERTTHGSLWLSGGKVRLELEGSEKSLLVVNKKNLWAVTFPPAEFKDAAISVIKADTSTRKGRSHSFVTLLSLGGFLKFFTPTGVTKEKSGDVVFFLSPKQEQVDFRRAQVRVSSDGKRLLELKYWDDRDNEVSMKFTQIKFVEKIEDKVFDYTPPKNADVMDI
jgi:outer membrane lipoprotein-sorting protein